MGTTVLAKLFFFLYRSLQAHETSNYWMRRIFLECLWKAVEHVIIHSSIGRSMHAKFFFIVVYMHVRQLLRASAIGSSRNNFRIHPGMRLLIVLWEHLSLKSFFFHHILQAPKCKVSSWNASWRMPTWDLLLLDGDNCACRVFFFRYRSLQAHEAGNSKMRRIILEKL